MYVLLKWEAAARQARCHFETGCEKYFESHGSSWLWRWEWKSYLTYLTDKSESFIWAKTSFRWKWNRSIKISWFQVIWSNLGLPRTFSHLSPSAISATAPISPSSQPFPKKSPCLWANLILKSPDSLASPFSQNQSRTFADIFWLWVAFITKSDNCIKIKIHLLAHTKQW